MQTLSSAASEAHRLSARDRLIVALDNPTLESADRLVRDLGSAVSFYKIGWRLFLSGGLRFVDEVRATGKNVFLDLKMDDIEATIESAVAVLRGRANLLTLMGSAATVKAAVRGRGDASDPRLLSVTLLSSLDESDLRSMLPETAILPKHEILPNYICQRARQAIDAGADGLIASGDSVKQLRLSLGWKPLIVTPGIRPAGAEANDQKRTKTPDEAIAEGSDLLVVGRPIWAAADPVGAAQAVIAEIELGLTRRG